MKKLSKTDFQATLILMEQRFEEDAARVPELNWADIQSRFEQQPEKLWSIYQMEQSGGQPNLLEFRKATDTYVFCDFSKESPKDRRSLCYDAAALAARKKFKPADSAMAVAQQMGTQLMDEVEYRKLQAITPVDTKTSSWLATPPDMRKLGGALFGDYRFGQVFIYHNGAESYYAGRGFRAVIEL